MGCFFSRLCKKKDQSADAGQEMTTINNIDEKIKALETAISDSETDMKMLEEEKTVVEQQAEMLIIKTNQEARLQDLGKHIARLDKTIAGFRSRLQILQATRLELKSSADMHRAGKALDGATNAAPKAQLNIKLINLDDMKQKFAKIEEEMNGPIKDEHLSLVISTLKSKASTKASKVNASNAFAGRANNYIDESIQLTAGQKPPGFNPLMYAEFDIESTMGPEARSSTKGKVMFSSYLDQTSSSMKKMDERLSLALREPQKRRVI